MTGMSGDSRILGAGTATAVAAVPVPSRELRSGSWTRLGGQRVLGDAVTEHTLAGLAEDARDAARAQGYARGWGEGRRAAEQQTLELAAAALEQQQHAEQRREAEHRAALDRLAQATSRLDRAVVETCAEVEARAGEVAASLTEALVGHQLRLAVDTGDSGLDAVRRALALAVGEPIVRVRVSPQDRPAIAASLAGSTSAGSTSLPAQPGQAGQPGRPGQPGAVVGAGLPEQVAGLSTAALIDDPTLLPGDAVVETTAGVVDARVSEALARVQEVLRG